MLISLTLHCPGFRDQLGCLNYLEFRWQMSEETPELSPLSLIQSKSVKPRKQISTLKTKVASRLPTRLLPLGRTPSMANVEEKFRREKKREFCQGDQGLRQSSRINTKFRKEFASQTTVASAHKTSFVFVFMIFRGWPKKTSLKRNKQPANQSPLSCNTKFLPALGRVVVLTPSPTEVGPSSCLRKCLLWYKEWGHLAGSISGACYSWSWDLKIVSLSLMLSVEITLKMKS